jgi:hypothetical protein
MKGKGPGFLTPFDNETGDEATFNELKDTEVLHLVVVQPPYPLMTRNQKMGGNDGGDLAWVTAKELPEVLLNFTSQLGVLAFPPDLPVESLDRGLKVRCCVCVN